jgi:hypothetical protein
MVTTIKNKATFKLLENKLDECLNLASDSIELESDDDLGTLGDIYGQIQDVINNLGEVSA